MAITYSEAIEPNAYRFIPDTYAITLSKEGQESTAPSLLTGNQLRDMLNLRVRQLARDIISAVEDGGLNEEGFAVDTSLWSQCIEDITRAIAFINMEVARRKEITLTIHYAGTEPLIWTISRVESAA